jgi:hypothetical protein
VQFVEALCYKLEDLNGVTKIFHWHNPSSHTMALSWIQSLTEMSTSNISCGGKDSRCIGLTNLPPSCLEIWKSRNPWTLRACNRPVQGLLYILYYTIHTHIVNIGKNALWTFTFVENCRSRGASVQKSYLIGNESRIRQGYLLLLLLLLP